MPNHNGVTRYYDDAMLQRNSETEITIKSGYGVMALYYDKAMP